MRVVLAIGAVVALACLIAAPSLWSAMRHARAGRAALDAATTSIKQTDVASARPFLATANAEFATASSRLDSIWVAPTRHVPVIGRQLAAASALARAGELASRAARVGVGALDPLVLRISGGRIDLAALSRMREAAESALPDASHALSLLDASPRSWVLPPLSHARSKAVAQVSSAVSTAEKGSAGLRAAPWLLGADAPRRYVVFFANPAESRGTGGLWGLYTYVDASAGAIHIESQAGRPSVDLPDLRAADLHPPQWYADAWGSMGATSIWQNINLSPDFPTVAGLVVEALHRSVDGVIQVDPAGLGALLKITGPVSIASWPEPIDASNVERIAMHDVYERWRTGAEEAERTRFGAEMVRAVVGRVLSSNFSFRRADLSALSAAGAGRHVQMYATDARAQQALSVTGLSGGLDRPADSDVVGVFTNNAAGGKADWYLHRDVRVSARVGARTAETTVTVLLRNDAPATGLPPYVTGTKYAAGENAVIVEVVRGPGDRLLGAWLDGRGVNVATGAEGTLTARRLLVSIRPGQTVRLELRSEVPVGPAGYRVVELPAPGAQPATYQAGRG